MDLDETEIRALKKDKNHSDFLGSFIIDKNLLNASTMDSKLTIKTKTSLLHDKTRTIQDLMQFNYLEKGSYEI